ncbi:isocitrate dehydrogenase (NADP) [Lachnospiraceae bacterium RM5]|nr:isocitrate dehydrogenase (NADP) [Lachnospiraceae bacterium RM5]
MDKIKMTTPLVEMDGDEMTRILWKFIKDELLIPFIDLNTEYYDLGLENRNATDDQVTIDSANATKKYGVAVKCATITPNAARMDEYDLKQMWKSPNGTIRAILDGTVFRAPIVVNGIEPCVKNWKKPITIARHAYGDVYKATEMKAEKKGKAYLTFVDEDGNETRELIHEFETPGVIQGQHNINQSIESFARSCFSYALSTKQDIWFSTKDTISKKYDHTFKDIFAEIFENEFKDKFEEAGIEYFYTLIDDAVARVMKSEGGFIWACKNYDGDVMSDMISSAFGSLAMMTSVLVSPDGYYEYEAAHGTVQRHYYKHLKGEETSTNSVATIFAWSGALRKRGELDNNAELVAFADKLEKACIKTIEDGKMTGDLARITTIPNPTVLNSENFIKAIRETMENM